MRPILYSWSVELASIYNFSEVFTQWGPAYVITFEVRITQFDGQLVYFGTKNGDSVPSVVAKNNNHKSNNRNENINEYKICEIRPPSIEKV